MIGNRRYYDSVGANTEYISSFKECDKCRKRGDCRKYNASFVYEDSTDRYIERIVETNRMLYYEAWFEYISEFNS